MINSSVGGTIPSETLCPVLQPPHKWAFWVAAKGNVTGSQGHLHIMVKMTVSTVPTYILILH